jgi:uncharacterized protein YaiL (DUF2058 family)
MEIKKRLNAAAKRITPNIEASNTGLQLIEICARIEELLAYVEHREERAALTKETGLNFAMRERLRRSESGDPDHVVAAAVQAEDEKAQLEDQQQVAAQPDAG